MAVTMIQQVSRGDYDIRGLPRGGHLTELTWYATENNKIIGVVVQDRSDDKFNWMVLTENDSGPGFTGIDLGVSVETEEDATAQLHTAMNDEAEIQRLKKTNR